MKSNTVTHRTQKSVVLVCFILLKLERIICCLGTPSVDHEWSQRVALLVAALHYKPAGRGFDSRWCHWNFLLTQSFRPHYGPGVHSVSDRNEYQEYLVVVKAAGALGWQPYHLHVATVLKSGRLNFLEHSGPIQACTGIALPLCFII
jgi:hypothetical protein